MVKEVLICHVAIYKIPSRTLHRSAVKWRPVLHSIPFLHHSKSNAAKTTLKNATIEPSVLLVPELDVELELAGALPVGVPDPEAVELAVADAVAVNAAIADDGKFKYADSFVLDTLAYIQRASYKLGSARFVPVMLLNANRISVSPLALYIGQPPSPYDESPFAGSLAKVAHAPRM